jgi:hypothetical protein
MATGAQEPSSSGEERRSETREPTRPEAVQRVSESTSGEIQGELEAGGDLVGVALNAGRHALEGARQLGVTAEEAAAGIARGAIAAALQVGGGMVHEAIAAGIRGALEVASEAGEDQGRVSRGAVRAGLDAATEAGLDLMDLAQSLARDVVQTTAELGGDVASAAQHAVAGAVEAARDFGRSEEDAASAAATGALEAAGQRSPEDAQSVRAALSEQIHGVEVHLREPNRRERLE